MDAYKSLNSSAITMKNPEMLKLIILKLKKCVSMQLKNYLIY